MNNPVFILGTQRSGSTLLTRALSSHPKIYIQNEMPLERLFQPDATTESISKNLKAHISKKTGLTVDTLADKFDIWGIKDPQLTEHIDSLVPFIKTNKFIILVRDARAVTSSYMDNKWGLGTNAYTGATRWKDEIQKQLELMKQYPKNFLLIKYEDLVENMEVELRKVCSHLDVEFSDAMLDYYQGSANFVANAANINTQKKPNASNAIKWQSSLTSRQIKIIEEVTRRLLELFNYKIQTDGLKLNRLEVLYYSLHQLVIGEFQIQWQLYKAKRRWEKNNSSIGISSKK